MGVLESNGRREMTGLSGAVPVVSGMPFERRAPITRSDKTCERTDVQTNGQTVVQTNIIGWTDGCPDGRRWKTDEGMKTNAHIPVRGERQRVKLQIHR